jgi:hypothetical protein
MPGLDPQNTMCGTLADDETHDPEFPQHSLSRARRYLREMEATLSFSEEVITARAFEP